jgi:hypothetical protein
MAEAVEATAAVAGAMVAVEEDMVVAAVVVAATAEEAAVVAATVAAAAATAAAAAATDMEMVSPQHTSHSRLISVHAPKNSIPRWPPSPTPTQQSMCSPASCTALIQSGRVGIAGGSRGGGGGGGRDRY